MPWEKSFDEQNAIEKAMEVFWEKGYEATSIADLIASTGINRGSLYNAFGGKRQLFTQSLLKYDLETRKAFLAELEALDNPVLAFKTLFNTLVQQAQNDAQPKGCFLVNTSIDIAFHDQETKNIVTRGFTEFEAFFRRGIEVSKARAEMPATLDAAATAKTLLSLVVAIRVLGRGIFDESSLQVIADQAEYLTSQKV
ncbi:MAG: TetR/AcrR family transcriptional regulator [Pseudomonadales bacterium]|nr:TetR/AcrR family transcriptional regulator [Pseudomonadales bacterium]